MNWSISEPGAKGAFRPWAALAALLAYGALWGCLSSLGSLSSLGLWALLPGGLLSAAAGGLPLGNGGTVCCWQACAPLCCWLCCWVLPLWTG